MAKVTRTGDWAKARKRMGDLAKYLDKLVPFLQSEAPYIRVEMQMKARVKTGYMRANIINLDDPDGFTIWSRAPYSGWQEFGTTTGITPNLFFRPPVAKANVELPKKIIKLLWSGKA